MMLVEPEKGKKMIRPYRRKKPDDFQAVLALAEADNLTRAKVVFDMVDQLTLPAEIY